MNFVNENSLKTRRDAFVKFSQVYVKPSNGPMPTTRRSIISPKPQESRKTLRRNPSTSSIRRVAAALRDRGLDVSLKQAVEFKFIPKPMTEKEVAGLFDILVPKK